MLSNPSTLLKVKVNRWPTQLKHWGPGSLCMPLFCCLRTWLHCTLMPTHCQKNKQQADLELVGIWELRYIQEWREDTARAQTSSENFGGFEMSFCHNTLCGLYLLSTQFLFYFYRQPKICVDPGTFFQWPLRDKRCLSISEAEGKQY